MEGRGGSRRGGRSVVSVNGGTVTVSPATAEAGPVKTSEKESGGEGGAKASVRSKAQENYARSMASRRGGRKSPPKPTAYVERREAAPTRVLSPPDQERVVSLGQQNRNDLEKLISTVPDEMMRMVLLQCCEQVTRENRLLKEIYLPLGRTAELVTCSLNGGDQRIIPSDQFMEASHLAGFSALFDEPGLPQNLRRTGISETLHRVSRTLNPVTGNLTSIAARVGRTIEGHVEPLLAGVAHSDFVLRGGASVLLVGPPNVGKTTVLRELARILSRDRTRVVAIVDKSLEIAGSGDVPHSSVGHARVLQVSSPENQHAVMIEAVENQSPDVVIVDEISSRKQAEAARTISQRGVQIIASVHGRTLASIVCDQERRELVGGVTSGVLLSDAKAELRADGKKAVEKRRGEPPFHVAIELRGFNDWIVHPNIGSAVDGFLDGRSVPAWRHMRTFVPNRGGQAAGGHYELAVLPVVACSPVDTSAMALAEVGQQEFRYSHLQTGESLPPPGARVWIESVHASRRRGGGSSTAPAVLPGGTDGQPRSDENLLPTAASGAKGLAVLNALSPQRPQGTQQAKESDT